MLDDFRSQNLVWDKANKNIFEKVVASQGDSNGRKLRVQVLDDGVVEDLSGANLSLAWQSRYGKKGLDAFSVVDDSQGLFEIYYTTGMLSNEGGLNASLVLVDSTGRIESDSFVIELMKSNVDDDSVQSEDSFTELTRALVDVSNLEENYAPRLANAEQKIDDNHQETTTQLAQIDAKKLDRNENESITKAMLSREIKEDLSAGEFEFILNTSEIEDGAVTPEKLSSDLIDIEYSENLFNPDDVKVGGYYRQNDGVWEESSTYNSSGFIRVAPDVTYTKKSNASQLVFWDKHYNYVSGRDLAGNNTFTVPNDPEIRYITYPFRSEEQNLMLVRGSDYPTEYIPYFRNLKMNENIELKVEGEVRKTHSILKHVEESPTKNLFNPNDVREGGYYQQNGGVWVVNNRYNSTGLIEVQPDVTYSKNNLGGSQLTFWDAEGVFISGRDLASNNTFTVPNDPEIKSLRFNIDTNRTSHQLSDIMLVEGEQIPEITIPYQEKKFIFPEKKYEFERESNTYMMPEIEEYPHVTNPVITRDIVTDREEVSGVADPFIVFDKGCYHMFFEVLGGIDPDDPDYPNAPPRDEIGHAYSYDLKNWTYTQIVLPFRTRLHRSAYPNVFKFEGIWYMIPDTASSIVLYRATDFPLKWRMQGTLIEPDPYSDTNIFRIGDVWYLTTVSSRPNADGLELYYNTSGDFRNKEWVAHPKRIIASNDNPDNEFGKRNGGNYFHGGDYIIFPLQLRSGGGYYGEYTDWYKLSDLSTENCTVTRLGRALTPSYVDGDWDAHAMHHISHVEHKNGIIYAVDGYLANYGYSIGLYREK